jgi:hydrocephalus-inducing protein
LFKPQEEVVYNFNLVCEVKRKPNKLSINIKGEGYAVHPVIQLEQSEENLQGNRFLTLRPAPAINYADFGSVQVLDTLAKTVTVVNNGKYNFDFLWDTENMGSMLSLGGGKVGGTLHKGESASYVVTFAPQREASLDGASLSLTVAGKYLYEIYARGMAVSPALRFSFMQHDFGNCFVTSPGGSTVVEEAVLRLVNHDPTNNITVECQFQKTRALWAECLPTVLEPGGSLEVPIRFAPRDVKDYTFVVPFVVNGTSKVNVMILGKGINARLEMVTASQRRTNFGLVNVGSEVRKIVALVNRSKRALPVQLTEEAQYGAETLADRCVQFFPSSEFVIAPRETAQVQLVFAPNRRLPTFSQDLMVRYAGTTRKLLTVSGKAQGVEVALDTDSLPFGSVVIDSQKVKKLTLENSGDIGITFNWLDATLGKHFTISPMSGKVLPNSEVQFDVTFRPKNLDDDINQSGMTLLVPGLPPLALTCTGACIAQPDELTQTLQFSSLARKAESKAVKMTNPTDKDWFLSPSLNGENWRIPREVKVPAKGSADMTITYFPLTMSPAPAKEPAEGEPDSAHKGQLFVSLPDGSAALYKLRGYAGHPECSGQLSVETPAKKPAQLSIKVNNWLAQPQRLQVTVDLLEQPSPATFVIAANAVEVGPNGTKEFPLRFLSFTEGQSKARITFANASGEYMFYDLTAKATMPEVLETVSLESSARQSARTVLTLENPLPASASVSLAGGAKPDDWWSCDSPCIRVKELSPLSGNTEGSFEVEYRPLAPTTQPAEHLVSIMTKELGTFKYKVVVTATPAANLPTLRFSVPLGSVATETLSFKAYNTAKADYSCSSKRPDFISLPKTVPVEAVADWAGTDVAVPITFEPTELGEVLDTVTISAPGGLEYVCSVVAECVAPTPQGPFSFARGQTQDVSFRNFLAAPCAWNFSLDSTAFRTTAPNANVPAKGQGAASVVFDPKEEHANAPGGVVTAKLFVKCATKPELAPFIFYLRGNLAGGAAVEAAPAGKKK